MLDPIHDECGLAAVSWTEGVKTKEEVNAISYLPPMLLDLQNRGQLAAGISRYNGENLQLLDTYKDVGSVNDVFRLSHPNPAKFASIMRKYSGRVGIGHVRYATCGKDDIAYAQPFERKHSRTWKWFSFCFNGNIANYEEVKESLLKEGYHLALESDTELIQHHLCYALRGEEKPSFESIFAHLADKIDGAWSLAFLNADGDLVIARDPYGLRPLCYGTLSNEDGILFAAASESTALANIGITDIQDLNPGECLHVKGRRSSRHIFVEPQKKSFCFFEHVYFANVASKLEGRSVYATRRKLGEILARGETKSIDPCVCITVPVPDTAKSAADGMAFQLGIPSREGLIRNRYVGRTFIESADRETRVRRKYTILPEVVKDKKVFLVEDSIVRSTTLRIIVKILREAGVKELHVRVTCPPIVAPCMYGIDISTTKELFVPKYAEDPLNLTMKDYKTFAEELDVDSIRYLTVAETQEAIGSSDLCLGCVTGKYPTPWGNKLLKGR